MLVTSDGAVTGKHWRCDEAFLGLCGLRREDVQQHVRTWWGNQDLWLDMLATEIGKGIGSRLELDDLLGSRWTEDVDTWLRAAYDSAVAGMSTSPSSGIMQTKASGIIREVLRRVTQGAIDSFRFPSIQRVTCKMCQKPYLAALNRCSSCSPPVSSAASSAPPLQEDLEWQKLPSADISSHMEWKKASAMHWCSGGSGGVTLLALPSGATCIKKFCPMELMATNLSAVLNVRTAYMRVLLPGSAEKRAACGALSSFRGGDDDMQVRKTSRAPVLTVMEFINGCVMMGVPANLLLSGNRPELDIKEVWYGLGKLAAFDLLINNYDRLPLAWSNCGNLGNIILGASVAPVVGIDQAVHPIHHEEGLRRYTERVRSVVMELRRGAPGCLKPVSEAVYNNTGITLSQDDLAVLRSGALDFLRKTVALADFDLVLTEVCTATHDALKLEATSSEASAREACEAGMMLEALPRSISQARDMISKVLCTVKEALTANA